MPLAILRDEVNKTQTTARMPVPKKVTSLEHWYREARKVIPTLPDISLGEWRLENTYASEQFVAWEVVHVASRKRVYLTIDRCISLIG